ncbi:hypothetical protein COB11_07005 [Candidatus Aerophobetes bacterium]|uniref:Uncharacterized protein n=1 Tax=Aerophobetes bacterium TaxID=2030807 RepID=A0A2A4YCD8_UNCAE|nr:MAG: hypothetical protein COB11_07005 [Candidatus Aerophobetes bacterium]
MEKESQNESNRNIAEESLKTKKVREKLKRHFEKIDEEITKQALNRKITEIHRWISRHAMQRVTLKSKSISLFDENQNTARISQKVSAFAIKLKGKLLEESEEHLAINVEN